MDGIELEILRSNLIAAISEQARALQRIALTRKDLLDGSGAAGRAPGGDGQGIEFRMPTRDPGFLNTTPGWLRAPVEGLEGGGAGRPGRFLINGEPLAGANKMTMATHDEALLETPGGGFGAAE